MTQYIGGTVGSKYRKSPSVQTNPHQLLVDTDKCGVCFLWLVERPLNGDFSIFLA
jgi:hypothetical protein